MIEQTRSNRNGNRFMSDIRIDFLMYNFNLDKIILWKTNLNCLNIHSTLFSSITADFVTFLCHIIRFIIVFFFNQSSLLIKPYKTLISSYVKPSQSSYTPCCSSPINRRSYYINTVNWNQPIIKWHTLGECPPALEIGWEFHSLQNFWQSSLINSRNRWWSNQRWEELFLSRRWHLSKRRKKARHWRTNHCPTSTQRRSIRVLNTDGPHIKLAQLSPRSKIIRIDTSRFSPPLSPRTLEGTPCSIIASINMSRTVSDWLFEFAWSPVTYPDVNSWYM